MELDAALDAVIAKCKAQESQPGPGICITNIHVGSDLDICTVIGKVLSDFTEVENTKVILEDVIQNCCCDCH